jgi:hypothetical protein
LGLVGVLGGTFVSSSSAAATSTVVFRDDFSGTGLPGSNWLIDTGRGYPGGPQGGFGTDSIETVTNSTTNVNESGGKLLITPVRDASGNWTSGRIETKDVFKPADGQVMRMESSLALPDVHGAQASGYWPAFWALSAPERTNPWSWPNSGEFDFTESVNGVAKNWATLHCGIYTNATGGPCGEPSGISNGGVAASTDVWGQSHLYAFEWDRSRGAGNDQLRWYVDGNLVHSLNQNDPRLAEPTWSNMTSHAGYFIIFDVAIGGQFPAALGGGPTPATTSGVPLSVDYVQVSYSGTSVTPTTSMPSTSSPSSSTAATESSASSSAVCAPTTVTQTPVTVTQTVTQTVGSSSSTAPTTTTAPTTSSSVSNGAPTNLHVQSTTGSSITIAWDGTAGTSYNILRSGIKIATVSSLSFTDIGLLPNTPYIYSVQNTAGTTPQITATIK